MLWPTSLVKPPSDIVNPRTGFRALANFTEDERALGRRGLPARAKYMDAPRASSSSSDYSSGSFRTTPSSTHICGHVAVTKWTSEGKAPHVLEDGKWVCQWTSMYRQDFRSVSFDGANVLALSLDV
mmetsp:Transcript_155236/g.498003  ORF Transcript_155236/g.498003 Transcript_155236/m.498003 type:complete len:126 (-) Transcript_155236:137-514(-)